MKIQHFRSLCTFIAVMLAAIPAVNATPDLSSEKNYKIVCFQFGTGCVTDGATMGLTDTPLYYKSTEASGDEDYWIFSEEQTGFFTIRNAKTGKYVTWDGIYQGTGHRYVSMTDTSDGQLSLWTFQSLGGGLYAIRNASHTDHLWDVRVSSFTVGTYPRSNDSNTNQQFYLYDKDGKRVSDKIEKSDPLADAVSDLSLGGHTLVYDHSNDRYYCPLPLSVFNTSLPVTVTFSLKDGWQRLCLGSETIGSGNSYTISNIVASTPLTVTVYRTDGSTLSKKVFFTSLPVVSIYGSFGDEYSEGYIQVTEPEVQHPLFSMKAKWRGGITNGSDKHKRNYHVKLKDADGAKLDHSFFGLRNDNSWILEACQVDMSRVRNRVITDLWNDFSTPPYYADREPKARTGSRGRFVELLLNDEYRGIYCMTENMDRKQMKLAKYDEATGTMHGMLWKSKDWSYAVFMGHNSNSNSYPGTAPRNYNNNSESWDQYYVKYPDFDDVRPTDWQTLYNAVKFVCTSSDNDFRNHVAEYFDLPLLTDYYILMETILSTDNHGKNMFFACYDQQESPMVTFGVWDMDATIGQRWSDAYYHSNLMQPEQDYATYITNNEHGDYNLFRRLRLTNAEDFNMRVRLRYKELRQNWLSTESILNRFRQQLAEFKTAGADKREYAKWSGDSDVANKTLNFDTELNYIENWVTRRMNYLDTKRFKISELSGIIETADTTTVANQHWYTLDGCRLSAQPTAKGLYIHGGRKVLVK